MNFNYLEREPGSGGVPKQLVVFLHGYGSNGADLISLAPEFYQVLPDAHFVSPDAPYPFEGGLYGAFQWYGFADRSDAGMLNNAKSVEGELNGFIDRQLARFKLKDKDLIVMGFSQGAMMAIHNVYRRPHKAKAVVSFSGFMAGLREFKKEVKSKPPILITHGTNDTIVPFKALDIMVNTLTQLDIKVTEHVSEGLGHGIDAECIEAAQKFLSALV
jgi:phospholipase/carboxylesterase